MKSVIIILSVSLLIGCANTQVQTEYQKTVRKTLETKLILANKPRYEWECEAACKGKIYDPNAANIINIPQAPKTGAELFVDGLKIMTDGAVSAFSIGAPYYGAVELGEIIANSAGNTYGDGSYIAGGNIDQSDNSSTKRDTFGDNANQGTINTDKTSLGDNSVIANGNVDQSATDDHSSIDDHSDNSVTDDHSDNSVTDDHSDNSTAAN